MKLERLSTVSNKYGVLKQVYDDKVFIRTNNVRYSKKYNCCFVILANNKCIWTNNVYDIRIRDNYEETNFVELSENDFARIKTYNTNFEGIEIAKEDEILTFEDAKKIAQEQEDMKLNVCIF